MKQLWDLPTVHSILQQNKYIYFLILQHLLLGDMKIKTHFSKENFVDTRLLEEMYYIESLYKQLTFL